MLELLVVIGIIAVLAGLLVPAVAIGMARARVTRTESLLGSVQAGLSAYLALNSAYPGSASDAAGNQFVLQDLLPGTDHSDAGDPGMPSEETLLETEVRTNNRILLAALRTVDRDSFHASSRHVAGDLLIDDWERPLVWRSYLRYPYLEDAQYEINGMTPPAPDSYQLWSTGPNERNEWGRRGSDDIVSWGR